MKKLLLSSVLLITVSCGKRSEDIAKILSNPKSATVTENTIGFKDYNSAEEHFNLIIQNNEEKAVQLRLQKKSDITLIKKGISTSIISESKDLSQIIVDKDTIWVANIILK